MRLLPEERKRLDLIEGTLRAEEPRLAAMFDVFTRLTSGEGKPPAERQFRPGGPWRYDAAVRHRARRCAQLAVALFLAAMIVILALELA